MITAQRSRQNSLSAAIALCLVLIAGTGAGAHRRDDYLQAARIGIEPERVQVFIDLTPGIAIAERVLLDIDRDGNASMSTEEGRSYARRLLSAVHLEVDGTPAALELVDTSMPALDAMRSGEGSIRVGAAARLPRLGDGAHRLLFRNSFRPDIGIYLANALVPDNNRVAVTAQRRDVDQRELTIEYTLLATRVPIRARAVALGFAGACTSSALILWRRREKHAKC